MHLGPPRGEGASIQVGVLAGVLETLTGPELRELI